MSQFSAIEKRLNTLERDYMERREALAETSRQLDLAQSELDNAKRGAFYIQFDDETQDEALSNQSTPYTSIEQAVSDANALETGKGLNFKVLNYMHEVVKTDVTTQDEACTAHQCGCKG